MEMFSQNFRKKGIMIHVASAAANMPTPLLSVYSASKVCYSRLSIKVTSRYE